MIPTLSSLMFSTIYEFRPSILNLRQIRRNLSSNTGRSLPTPPDIGILEGPTDWAEARKWATQFKAENIPKTLVELSFSRSSGPGGQVRLLSPILYMRLTRSAERE